MFENRRVNFNTTTFNISRTVMLSQRESVSWTCTPSKNQAPFWLERSLIEPTSFNSYILHGQTSRVFFSKKKKCLDEKWWNFGNVKMNENSPIKKVQNKVLFVCSAVKYFFFRKVFLGQIFCKKARNKQKVGCLNLFENLSLFIREKNLLQKKKKSWEKNVAGINFPDFFLP